MSLAGRVLLFARFALPVLMLGLFGRPTLGNFVRNSEYFPYQRRVSNIQAAVTKHQITNYPEYASQLYQNDFLVNHPSQYSDTIKSPYLQERVLADLYFGRPKMKQNKFKNDDGSAQPWVSLSRNQARNYGNAIEKHDKIKMNHPAGHISVKVYPPKRVADVEKEEYLGTFGSQKNEIQSTFNAEKMSPLPSLGISHLKTNRLNIQPESEEPEKLPVLSHHDVNLKENESKSPISDIYFVAIVAGCSAASIFGVIAAGICFTGECVVLILTSLSTGNIFTFTAVANNITMIIINETYKRGMNTHNYIYITIQCTVYLIFLYIYDCVKKTL
ncbi:uncharacterized protein LOC143247581 isoform X2 [Tachypleus tridentatus]|uniref:uncharacterized protein LOC143247581 isoform X2 n=1 Tax=Tachypleus tridentatus TaxID=6853 RepID=UPI003FD14874